MDLSPGAVIAGRYRVERKVGAGGMGEVWAGEHRLVGSRVAIKTLLAAAALNHEVVARFKREAYILGKIRSDHVARVVDFIADDVYGLVLVMELVEGEPLNRVLQEQMLSVEETIELGVDIASALCDLHHAHIVHRDLKPGNIILQTLQGGRHRAVVVDFGVSRLTSDGETDGDDEVTGITRADMAVGTIEYMAPEQILNSRAVTSVSDIYATGAILFRAVAGRHVFGNIASDAELAQKKLMTESPPLMLDRDDKLSDGLIRVVTRALRRKPVDRYQSAEDLLNDLLPLRDLARVANAQQLEIDKTINVSLSAAMAGHTASDPGPVSVPGPPSGQSAASSDGRLSLATSPPSLDAATPAPARRGGVPVAVMIAAMAVALGGGVVLGSGMLKQPSAPATTPEAASTLPIAAAPSAAAPASALPAATAAPSASASAAAPAAAAASASADEIPEVPATAIAAVSAPKKLWGPIPKSSSATDPTAAPTATATSTSALVPAPSAKPTPIIAKPPASAAPTVVKPSAPPVSNPGF
jgi:eukaryotic-like serine/threonine-protein kinase